MEKQTPKIKKKHDTSVSSAQPTKKKLATTCSAANECQKETCYTASELQLPPLSTLVN